MLAHPTAAFVPQIKRMKEYLTLWFVLRGRRWVAGDRSGKAWGQKVWKMRKGLGVGKGEGEGDEEGERGYREGEGGEGEREDLTLLKQLMKT